MDRMLTVQQAAEQMNRGVMAVYRRIWAGDIDAVDIGLPGAEKPTYRIPERALEAYFAKRVITRPAPIRRPA